MNRWRPRRWRSDGRVNLIRNLGAVTTTLSILGLVAALFLVESIANDYRASVSVTRSAVDVIAQTISAVDDIADGTTESLSSASASVDQASTTLDDAVVTLGEFAAFLEEDLPVQLETIRSAMPAAIQAADAVDGTLRALSLFGVAYNPDEPFGESLARIDEGLAGLPDDLRTQSEALRVLIPSAADLAAETGDLSGDLTRLADSLEGFTSLTGEYQETITEAQETIEGTSDSVESTIWLFRILAAIAALAGATVGMALISVSGALANAQIPWNQFDEDVAEDQPRETVE